MRRLTVPALLLAACAPPAAPHEVVPSLEHDYFLPAASSIGHREEALSSGDGTDGRLLLFLDFDGASIERVQNDVVSENSASNASWLPDTYGIGASKAYAAFDASPFVGFTDATARQYVVDHVTDWYTPFNVEVVSTRPTTGRYTMIMLGDSTTDFLSSGSAGSGTVGVATLDCGNESEINVGFDFVDTLVSMQQITSLADAKHVLLAVAQTAAHEAGHTFGLEHVSNTQDIMHPIVSSSVLGFVDSASTLSGGTSSCDNSSTSENTHSKLLANVGAAPGTTQSDMAHVPSTDMATASNPDLAPQPGAVGASCASSEDCAAGGVCATGDDVSFCTVMCSSTDECPSGYACSKVDDAKYCTPTKSGGCDYGGGGVPSALGLALASLFLLLRRRSSRPSAT